MSGKRETSRIEIPPTNEEDWILYNNLEETKRIDNNEIIKVKVEQYVKTILDNVEKNTKIGEVIVRVNKGNETVDQYLSEDGNNCLVIRSDTIKNNKYRLTSTTIKSSITNVKLVDSSYKSNIDTTKMYFDDIETSSEYK